MRRTDHQRNSRLSWSRSNRVAPGQLVAAADRAVLSYALKLTRVPASIGQSDVDALRSVGLDDRAIHDVCAIVAYFAFVNRIADGLEIELESDS